MRCLVTGASGFLGSHLVRELLNRNHSVTVLLRDRSKAARLVGCLEDVRVVRGSLEDIAELKQALREEPVDAAFHLAWAGVTADQRNHVTQITGNVVHSLAFWETLQNEGCRTLIGVGSQAEYGLSNTVRSEVSPAFPMTAYGSAKLALGILLKQLCQSAQMRFVWLRLFSAYGPADEPRHMIPSLIETLIRRERPALTAGEQVWDFLYVSDVVAAFCACLESDADGVFNLASGSTCVLRAFIEAVRDCVDPSLPLGFGELAYRPDQVMHLEADVRRLQAATGWKPQVSLADGIRRTVQWYARGEAPNGI